MGSTTAKPKIDRELEDYLNEREYKRRYEEEHPDMVDKEDGEDDGYGDDDAAEVNDDDRWLDRYTDLWSNEALIDENDRLLDVFNDLLID